MRTALAAILVGLMLLATAQAQNAEPTLQAKPPEGGVVLFDGKDTSAWETKDGKPAEWTVADSTMDVKGGDIQTKQKFSDFTLHVEFRTPTPKAGQAGQARGNSGVHLLGRYEIQILDSYGEEPTKNGCGSIYNQKAADVNACLAPLQWQTYDITFRAPRFDNEGKKTEKARVTVTWNGKLVHKDVEIDGPTRAGDTDEKPGPGPIRLQDHGHPVQFRNIWIVPAK